MIGFLVVCLIIRIDLIKKSLIEFFQKLFRCIVKYSLNLFFFHCFLFAKVYYKVLICNFFNNIQALPGFFYIFAPNKTISMAILNQYKCKGCGYTVAANPKGEDILMSGEEIECPVPDKCPEYGGELEKTKNVIFAD